MLGLGFSPGPDASATQLQVSGTKWGEKYIIYICCNRCESIFFFCTNKLIKEMLLSQTARTYFYHLLFLKSYWGFFFLTKGEQYSKNRVASCLVGQKASQKAKRSASS